MSRVLLAGVMITCLCWHWIGPQLQVLLFNGFLMSVLAVFCGVFMLGSSYVLRLMRLSSPEKA